MRLGMSGLTSGGLNKPNAPFLVAREESPKPFKWMPLEPTSANAQHFLELAQPELQDIPVYCTKSQNPKTFPV